MNDLKSIADIFKKAGNVVNGQWICLGKFYKI